MLHTLGYFLTILLAAWLCVTLAMDSARLRLAAFVLGLSLRVLMPVLKLTVGRGFWEAGPGRIWFVRRVYGLAKRITDKYADLLCRSRQGWW